LILAAKRARKIVANTNKKMQVPEYSPMELGAHDMEKRGVLVEAKKTMAIDSIVIIVASEEGDVGNELAVELAIGIVSVGINML